MKKRILAALLALGCALLVFTGCGSKKDTTPKDYTQIIHDAREAEDNDYYMIFSPAEDGKFTAQYGYSASYPADDLNDEIQNLSLIHIYITFFWRFVNMLRELPASICRSAAPSGPPG